MRKPFIALVLIVLGLNATAQKMTTLFETSGGKQTPEYKDIISWWQRLDQASPLVTMKTMGMTDAGYPLHLVIVSNGSFTGFKEAHNQKKTVLLINNGIHPGEPDGIDASMLLVRDIVEKKTALPNNIILAIIPVYNIGGCLNRSAYYRIDQDGPEAFGSRGNSQGLDLNRDFIKCDSKEAFAFAEIFHQADPDIFIDNHVSNGADYQHIMTLLASQHNKLGGKMGEYMNKQFEPALYSLMKKEGYDLIPYVNDFGENVTDGWNEFWDSPRYSSGYASLFQTFAFVPETHMLKPYSLRVKATYALMKSFISFARDNGLQLQELRKEARKEVISATRFASSYKVDSSAATTITFKGFEAVRKKSAVSGLPRLFYDRTKPFTKQIPFYNQYTIQSYATKPRAYIIPQGWWKVIDRLNANKIIMRPLGRDSTIKVEAYYITKFRSAATPYQAHHANTNVEVERKEQTLTFRKGDWLIPMNQEGNRFLMETLEPYFEDSYFSWNFFDGILNNMEGYSAYHYEDIAAADVEKDPELKRLLEQKRAADTSFAHSASAQLSFIFNHSLFKDPNYMRYPVFRINE
ncbi:peptidase M14 carboxypeptidase A [Niabella soli DSM 19437]|uniref:Peptidase M14 carboxypeptidase A n=2 Tax=Niabella TaxID=379899 RepID=W0F2K3_9BACT|nr:peptidase M14 carboxypeptidase A [Niabella soli DSM 19437]